MALGGTGRLCTAWDPGVADGRFLFTVQQLPGDVQIFDVRCRADRGVNKGGVGVQPASRCAPHLLRPDLVLWDSTRVPPS